MPHKRIEVAVEAFDRLGLPLVVVGDGPDARRLRRLAGPTSRFEGASATSAAPQLFAGCRALVVTATEEFGIAAVEAQAAGPPGDRLRRGRRARDGARGRDRDALPPVPTPRRWPRPCAGSTPTPFVPQACIDNAMRFDVRRFQAGLRAIVEEASELERPPRPLSRPRARPPPRPG